MSVSRRTLVVAPYLGEFGWELMNWQGRIRRMVRGSDYDRVVICARPDRRVLYADCDTEGQVLFCPIGGMELPGQANEDHRISADGAPIPPDELSECASVVAARACADARVDFEAADFFTPDYRGGLWSTREPQQCFVSLRRPGRIETDVILVARDRGIATERNQPETWWKELARRLERRGLRVECYQTPLDRAIRQLSTARLAAGASTGGLHLASLCGCPHYVWGSGAETRWTAMGITNRQRYETIWNPLGTPCRYDECGWQPTMEHVESGILGSLRDLALTRAQSRTPWSLRSGWRIRRQLARLLEAPSGSMWPWRVRQLVRNKLV